MALAPEPATATAPVSAAALESDRRAGGPGSAALLRAAAMTPLEVLRELDASLQGLDEGEAQARLTRFGDNALATERPGSRLGHVLKALADPFVVVLALLGVVSAVIGNWVGVTVIGVLTAISCGLRAGQEYRAGQATAALRALTATTTTVVRRAGPGAPPVDRQVPTDQLVPGDVVHLAAGDAVPADLRLLRSPGLTISQALLTGESLPVIKRATLTAGPTAHPSRNGADLTVFDHPELCLLGSTVVGGHGTAVVVATGGDTYFAAGNQNLPHRRGRTTFDRGATAVSWTLIRMMLAAVPAVPAVAALNGFSRGSPWQACLFAVVVAVGLIPEMLPVVVTTVLVRAAVVFRDRGVVVKRLPAIHNLGAMDVLCVDKTGTLTLDRLTVSCHLDPLGRPDPQPLRYAYLGARFGIEQADPPFADAVDEALLRCDEGPDLVGDDGFVGLGTLHFDPTRRRATVALRQAGQRGRELVVTKGAAEEVLDCCTHVRIDGRDLPLDADDRRRLHTLADDLHADGIRVLAVAVKARPASHRPLRPADEAALTLIGYVGLRDEAKPSAHTALAALADQGVTAKVLTGDHPLVAARACRDAGLDAGTPVCGHQIDGLDDQALAALARRTTLFARVDAHQKARIVTALRTAGHTVGYLGDGVNDVPALHAADVGVCVESAVDIARQSSEVLLVGKDLAAVATAVAAGRHAVGNITKYVKITVSSNVGNVFAAVAASITLPFLPMLPLQLLVQNLLFDLSQLALAFDHTDPEAQRRPHTVHTGDLTRFVLSIGAINALADLATFAALRHVLGDNTGAIGQAMFHTGWLIENLLTQVLAVHLLRSRGGASGWSWAARPVLIATGAVILLSLGTAVTPLGVPLGLHHLPPSYYLWLTAILAAYTIALTAGKHAYQKLFRSWL